MKRITVYQTIKKSLSRTHSGIVRTNKNHMPGRYTFAGLLSTAPIPFYLTTDSDAIGELVNAKKIINWLTCLPDRQAILNKNGGTDCPHK